MGAPGIRGTMPLGSQADWMPLGDQHFRKWSVYSMMLWYARAPPPRVTANPR